MQPMPKPQPPTQAEIDAARVTSKALLDKARAFIILDYPFFATIMLKKPMTERLDIPTLCVTDHGDIFYNPVFVAKQTPKQMVWAICHEVLHYASGHGIRRGARNPRKWNIAGDQWINDTLDVAKVGEPIPGCISLPGASKETVEDLYAKIPDDDGKGGGKGKGQGGGSVDGSGKGDPMDGDMEPSAKSKAEQAEIDGERKLAVSEAAAVAKMKGKLPGVLQQFAEETIDSKVPWFDVLERFMTERVKNDTSWQRPNRRYMPDFYLPTLDSVGAMGPVVVQVDISGSVSREEIRHYNGHIKRIVEQTRPSKVHVIYTDTKVQRHEEFDKPEDVQINFYSGGGTDMRAGFKYIERKGIDPEVVVTLTDGYTPFPDTETVPSIWCISSDVKSPSGETIHFSMTEEA